MDKTQATAAARKILAERLAAYGTGGLTADAAAEIVKMHADRSLDDSTIRTATYYALRDMVADGVASVTYETIGFREREIFAAR